MKKRLILRSSLLGLLTFLNAGLALAQKEAALKAIDPAQAEYDKPDAASVPPTPASAPEANSNHNPYGGGIQGQPLAVKRTLANPNPPGYDESPPGIPTQAGQGWSPSTQADTGIYEKRVAHLEQMTFGSPYPEHEVEDRLDHLENEIFSKKNTGMPVEQRLSRLESKLLGQTAFGQSGAPAPPPSPYQQLANLPSPGASNGIYPLTQQLNPVNYSVPNLPPANQTPAVSGGQVPYPGRQLPPQGLQNLQQGQGVYPAPSGYAYSTPPQNTQANMFANQQGGPYRQTPPPLQQFNGTGNVQGPGQFQPAQNQPQRAYPVPNSYPSSPNQYPGGMSQIPAGQNPPASLTRPMLPAQYQALQSPYPQGAVQGSSIPNTIPFGQTPYPISAGASPPFATQAANQSQSMLAVGSLPVSAGPNQMGNHPAPQEPASLNPGTAATTPAPAKSPGAKSGFGLTPQDRTGVDLGSFVKSIPSKPALGDYFPSISKFAGNSVARWTSFPILVHLPQGSPPSWNKALEDAVAAWGKYIPVRVATLTESADVEIAWINHLPPRALGQTNLEVFNGRMRVTVYLLRPSYYLANLSEKALRKAAEHEVGHAVGIFGHSLDPNDLMYSMEQSNAKDATKYGGISPRDLNTLKKIYEAPPLPPGFQSPAPMGWSLKQDR